MRVILQSRGWTCELASGRDQPGTGTRPGLLKSNLSLRIRRQPFTPYHSAKRRILRAFSYGYEMPPDELPARTIGELEAIPPPVELECPDTIFRDRSRDTYTWEYDTSSGHRMLGEADNGLMLQSLIHEPSELELLSGRPCEVSMQHMSPMEPFYATYTTAPSLETVFAGALHNEDIPISISGPGYAENTPNDLAPKYVASTDTVGIDISTIACTAQQSLLNDAEGASRIEGSRRTGADHVSEHTWYSPVSICDHDTEACELSKKPQSLLCVAQQTSTSERTPNATSMCKRAASLPIDLSTVSKLEEKAWKTPMRWASLPLAQNEVHGNVNTERYPTPALNGVSFYYASKSSMIVPEPKGDSLEQLTNSQKLRYRRSMKARMPSPWKCLMRPTAASRSCSFGHERQFKRAVTYAKLLRSNSCETAQFCPSPTKTQTMRLIINEPARSRQLFCGGKVLASSNSLLLRAAYPTLRCIHCPRVFKGVDRRRRCARHYRNVHGSTRSSKRKDIDVAISCGNSHTFPILRKGVLSVDEFLLGNPIVAEVMDSSGIDDYRHSQTAMKADATPDSLIGFCETIDRSHIPYYVSETVNTPFRPYVPIRPAAPTTTSHNTGLSSRTKSTIWDEAYVPWSQDRFVVSDGSNNEHVELLEQAAFSTSRCQHCGVTYSGLLGTMFLARHIDAMHGSHMSQPTVDGNDVRCPFCEVGYRGKTCNEFLQRHMKSRHRKIGPEVAGALVLPVIEEEADNLDVPEACCPHCEAKFGERQGKTALQQHAVDVHLYFPPRGTENQSPIASELSAGPLSSHPVLEPLTIPNCVAEMATAHTTSAYFTEGDIVGSIRQRNEPRSSGSPASATYDKLWGASTHLKYSEYLHKVPGSRAGWPKHKCMHCELEFTGKYAKGNAARHMRSKHGMVSFTIDKTVHQATKMYSRVDTTRKHKWKRHRRVDI